MRKTDLKHATTGVVLAVFLTVVLLGILRASVLYTGEAHSHEHAHSGAALFIEKGCARCHYADRKETKIGPGLKGLFDRETLPVSGRPVNKQNVRRQLEDPYQNMPSFSELSDEEKEKMIQYLQSL